MSFPLHRLTKTIISHTLSHMNKVDNVAGAALSRCCLQRCQVCTVGVLAVYQTFMNALLIMFKNADALIMQSIHTNNKIQFVLLRHEVARKQSGIKSTPFSAPFQKISTVIPVIIFTVYDLQYKESLHSAPVKSRMREKRKSIHTCFNIPSLFTINTGNCDKIAISIQNFLVSL